MGKKFRNEAIAASLNKFPSMENQLSIYKELFDNLPENEREADNFLSIKATGGTATAINKEAVRIDQSAVVAANIKIEPVRFPSPDKLSRMSLQSVIQYNEKLVVSLYDRLIIKYLDPNIPSGYVSNPDNEQGIVRISGYASMGTGTNNYSVSGSVVQVWNHDNINLSMLLTMIHLVLGRPVVMSASVTPSFDSPDANGFAHYAGASETSRGGHALHITGFIENAKLSAKLPGATLGAGGGYFIVKNSWGTCFGDAGYIYLPYNWIRNYAYSMQAFY